MNGFSYSTDRWYFAILLFMILATLTCMEKIVRLSKRQIIIFEAVSAGLILLNLSLEGRGAGTIFRSMILLVFAVILPVAWNCRKREKCLLAVICMMIVFNGLLVFGHSRIGGSGYTWGFVSENAALESMQESVADIEPKKQEGFVRTDVYSSSLATSMVMDYYGTTEYFSMPNAFVSEFYRTLYISPGVRSATHILKGLDGREELLSLLSVGQYMDFSMEDGQAVPFIKENETRLPLGFTYKEWVDRDTFNDLNPVEKQSLMLKAVVLEETPEAPAKMSGDFRLDEEIGYTLEYRDIRSKGEMFTTTPGGRIRIILEEPADTDAIYVQFRDFIVHDEGVCEFYVGNKSLQLRNREDIYYMGEDEFWVYVTELAEENGRQYFDILFGGENAFSLENIKVYEHKVDTAAAEERKAHTLRELTIGTDTIAGTVGTEQGEILFLSVPYSQGWKAYVDGEETEILRANVAFMAIEMPEGEHSVFLKYETPGLKAGAAISIASGMLLILTFRYERRKKRKNGSGYKSGEDDYAVV